MGSSPEHEGTGLSGVIRKTVIAAAVALLLYGAAAFLLRSQLHQVGIWMKEDFGLLGVGIYCLLVDMLIVPTTIDIIFPLTSSWPPVPLLAVISAASMTGGFLGYLIARELDHLSVVHRLTQGYRDRGKRLIDRYGGWAVAIAGFTPLPFSTICWIAGLLKVPWKVVLIAVLFRIPRIIIYYLLIKGGVEVLEHIPWQTAVM